MVCLDFALIIDALTRKLFENISFLPVIDDVRDKLHSAKVFTNLDLKNGCSHVEVDENSCKYASFVMHEGQYEFLKYPFSLTNSTSVLQRYIYNVFCNLLKDDTVVIYMDDLIIPSEDETQGIKKFKQALQTVFEYGLE